MSTTFEDRLRVALRDLADDVGASPALRWSAPQPARLSRRWVLPLAVATVVVALLAGALVALRPHRPTIVEPVQHPPKIFRVTGEISTAPGRATMAVTLTDVGDGNPDAPAYLVGTGDGAVRTLPAGADLFPVESQRLAAGGRFLVRKNQGAVGPAHVLVDLLSGRIRPIDDRDALFLELSPDGRTVAEYTSRTVRLRRIGGGDPRVLRRLATPAGTSVVGTDHPGFTGTIGAIGWAPGGDRLALHDGSDTLVVDLHGDLRARLPQARLVNGSQSWSPDGARLLVYDNIRGRFSVRAVDGSGDDTRLSPPRGALRPVGWSGSRVVWLSGAPGDQRLVACAVTGGSCATWLRFDVGSAGVEGVTWSDALAGARGRSE